MEIEQKKGQGHTVRKGFVTLVRKTVPKLNVVVVVVVEAAGSPRAV